MTRRERLRALLKLSVTDSVADLLYYGRKEDEEGLDTDAIEEMFTKGWMTADELARWYDEAVREAVDRNMPEAENGGDPGRR